MDCTLSFPEVPLVDAGHWLGFLISLSSHGSDVFSRVAKKGEQLCP
jgi:hypothetical protein